MGLLQNGDLLSTAEAEGFEAIITTDQNLRYQQNLGGRRLPVVVLMTTSWPLIRPHTAQIMDALAGLKSGDYIELRFPPPWLS